MFTLVYSDGCDDSKRLRGIIESIEPLKQKMHVLTDLDKMDELKITHVPTIVDQSGHQFVTNDAFIWLKRQIEGMGGNPDQFGLSDVDDGSKGGGKASKMSKVMMYLIGLGVVIVAYYVYKNVFKKSGGSSSSSGGVQIEEMGDGDGDGDGNGDAISEDTGI